MAAQNAGTAPAPDVKKKCKVVKKRVNGHIKKVRVCTKPKPAQSLPAKVSVTLDPTHAATASISAEAGATLTAGVATLTVPAGAVDGPTNVTMTPVTLKGLPGTVVAAFEFKPDGLQLQQPVTLTIPVTGTSGLTGFSYAGNGGNFHLYPLKVVGGKATLTLFHFSGYGAGRRLPAPSISKLRRTLITVVEPAVKYAIGDSSAFELAVQLYTSWKTELDHLSAAERKQFGNDLSKLEGLLAAALRSLAKEEHKKCVESHDVFTTAARINHALDLLAAAVGLTGPIAAAANEAADLRNKCESFELDFQAVITWQTSQGSVISNVHTHGLELSHANLWTNQQPLQYLSFDFLPGVDVAPCTVTTSTQVDKPFHAKIVSLGSPPSPDHPTPKIVVDVDTGMASETVTISCPRNTTSTGHPKYWSSGVAALHGQSTSFTASDWEYVGDGIFARKEYTDSIGVMDGTVAEEMSFILRHTPQ